MIRRTLIHNPHQLCLLTMVLLFVTLAGILLPAGSALAELRAGAAKVDITHPDSKGVESPLHSRALRPLANCARLHL